MQSLHHHNHHRRHRRYYKIQQPTKPCTIIKMDLTDIANKLGLSESKHIIRRGAELRRLCDVQFDSSIMGVGEVCKAVICLEIAATRAEVLFDRQAAIKLSGISEKAYNRSFNCLQNGLGLKTTLDIRELGIQFGCVRLVPIVRKGLSLFKDRFMVSLPASRRASTDFTRPVFTAVAFYLCAKKHKLKVDKLKLIELSGSSESEFSSVSASMKDLCHDIFGISKEKKDAKDVKGNRDLLDALPGKRRIEDGGYLSDDGSELSSYKKRKCSEKRSYNEWKSTVVESNKQTKAKVLCKELGKLHSTFQRKSQDPARIRGFVRWNSSLCVISKAIRLIIFLQTHL